MASVVSPYTDEIPCKLPLTEVSRHVVEKLSMLRDGVQTGVEMPQRRWFEHKPAELRRLSQVKLTWLDATI